MKTIVLDNVESVEYQGSLPAKGRLSNINVIFSKSGHIMNFFGPGLQLTVQEATSSTAGISNVSPASPSHTRLTRKTATFLVSRTHQQGGRLQLWNHAVRLWCLERSLTLLSHTCGQCAQGTSCK